LTNSNLVFGKAKYRTQGFKLCPVDPVVFPVDNTIKYLGKQVILFKIF